MSDEQGLDIRRRPGRPPKEVNQLSSPIAPSPIPQAPAEIGGRRRAARNVFGQNKQKLSYEARPGYHRHWFNDVGNRIGDAEQGGYEKVLGKDGKPVSKTVGSQEHGAPIVGYLMEIPEEWYKEDMAEQQAAIDEKEALIKGGKLEVQADDRRYVPTRADGSSMMSIRRG